MTESKARPRTPWHLWVVGVLSLLWYVSGAWVFMQAQSGAAMDMDATEIAYYAAQPWWFVAVTDLAFVAAILAAIALLLRRRWAVHLYALSLAAIVVTTVVDFAQGTALQGQDWLILSCVTTCLAIAQLVYAWWMRNRGVLR